ncbi:Tfp pilus assembly protein PilW [Legionella quateirensis]|uniref:Tfp pilus assembly protein PilW n=2 Tax=Legionella quateirensis TaxID=45072 RepID=A0A378KTX5_9GAMM|nr:hypothetical protein Lqua_0947 [Legionella quateirensis]STY18035.1 Tfp pilus assembly protein PilW [Legionella quateirensis]
MPISRPTYITMRTIKGFTLIEMIMVMVLSGIIFAIASVMLNAGFTSYFTGINVTGLNNQAALVMARMTKELEQAVSFSVINSSNVSFTTSNGESITYTWVSPGPTLTRTGISSQPLSDVVTGFALTYYQSDFNSTSTLALVRAITINMTLREGDETIQMINTVFLNNIK